MLNSIIIQGYLASDPEVRTNSHGNEITCFSIAVKRSHGEETDFFRCYAWGSTGQNIARYFMKGKPAVIEGSVQSSQKTSKDGKKYTDWYVNVNRFYFELADKTQQPEKPAAPAQQSFPDEDDLPF